MANHHAAEITQAISRFEAAWVRGESPQLESFIPQGETDNAELIAELIAIDLERRHKANEAIRVETYLEQFPLLADSPADVVDLIAAEYRHRSRLNPAIAVDEYLERFPQFREQLRAQFAELEATQVGSEQNIAQSITATDNAIDDDSNDGLLQRMVELGLVTEQTIDSCRQSLPADSKDDQQLIHTLLEQGHVTAWQLKQLRAGQKTFVLENGRYLLLDELGKGGMGTVYRARHVGLNRDVALKTIDPRQAKNKQLIGRFQREISVCAKLQHEHIVQAYDMGCHQGVHFLVLEYVTGADLASVVKRDGPLPPDEAAAVGLQVAAALAYAHAQGIVHRDIKPHNILLSTDGITKLLDMGLASNRADDGAAEALTSLTQTGMVLGTADYMPPEQAADLAKVDGRSDIYSLGATLYYLLTGRPPFPGGDMMSKMHRLANEEPAAIGQLRPDCPRELTDVIERMLAKRPEQRHQSAVEVVQALQPLAAERIAGRHVMTRAVHTAAETDTATPNAGTVAVTPFALETADTVATTFLRPRKQSSLGKWLIAAAIAVPALIGFAIWGVMSGNDQTTMTDESDPPAETGSVSPDQNQPPSKIRIKPRLGHYAVGSAMVWSADGRYFATGRDDGDVRIWEPNELKTIATYTGHRYTPIDVAISPDGKTVASRDRMGELHFWRSFDGKLLYKVNQPANSDVQFSPSGDEIALCGPNGLVRWSISGRRPIHLVSANSYDTLRYSPSGHKLAARANWRLIDIWDFQTPDAREPKFRFPIDPLSRLQHVAGDFVFISETELALTGDGFVEVRNVDSGEIVRKFAVPKPTGGIEFTPDGSKLLLSTAEGVAQVDLATEKTEILDQSFRFHRPGTTNSVAPGGSRYITPSYGGDTRISLNNLNAKTSRQLPNVKLIGMNDFAPVGTRYLHINSSETDEVCEFDLATGRPNRNLNIIGRPYLTNDERFLAVVASGNSLHVEALPMPGTEAEHEVYPAFEEKPDFRAHHHGHLHLQGWSHAGDRYWRSSIDFNRLRFWDVRTGKGVQTVNLSDPDIRWDVMPGSRFLVERKLADGQTGAHLLLKPLTTVESSNPVAVSVEGNPPLSLVALSADDRRILVKPDTIQRLYLIDTADGRQLKELLIPEDIRHIFGGGSPSIEISSSGRYLLLYDRIYDLNEAARSPIWKAAEHSHVYYQATLLGDDRHIVMRLGDRIELWDWKNDNKRLTIYLLPDQQWLLYNHETSHWNSSSYAFRFVECLYRDADGKEEWLVPFVYEQRTGWANDPSKAGLADLLSLR